MSQAPSGSIVVLTGGVGGAKLVKGLAEFAPDLKTTAIVNTGDDFEHLGLWISPDVDTLLYTLSDLADPVRGWGRVDESWNFMAAIEQLGGETWFALGDRDLALHVERTRRLRSETLSQVTARFAARLGIRTNVVPMSDAPLRTFVETDEGELPFQRYFVERRCEPRLLGVRFEGAERADPAPAALDALRAPDLAAILVAPSNPWLSIDPILAVPGLRQALRAADAPIVAVNPLPGGQAVKGPTAKIMDELGLHRDVAAIAAHYAGLVDAWLIDHADGAPQLACPHAATDTIMRTREDRVRVARAALDLAMRR